MTKTKTGLVVVTAIVIGALVCGCQEEQASSPGVSDVKGNRLIGAENVQLKGQIETLKKQIEALQGQIEQQKQQAAKSAQQTKEMADKCKQEKQEQIAQLQQEKQRQIAQFEQEKQQQIAQLQQAWQAELKASEDKSMEMLGAQAENMQGLTGEIAALKAELEKIKGTNKVKK
jgi:hypothetical protein